MIQKVEINDATGMFGMFVLKIIFTIFSRGAGKARNLQHADHQSLDSLGNQ